MKIRPVNNEVLYADGPIVNVSDEFIKELAKRAFENPRKRMRLCSHASPEDRLHEMLIVLTNETYIQPHRHDSKIESFHIIEGRLDVMVFNDDGMVRDVIEMGPRDSGLNFYYRLNQALFHTPLIRSDYVVIHETTNGPFDTGDTEYAAWAPPAEQIDEGLRFLSECKRSADQMQR